MTSDRTNIDDKWFTENANEQEIMSVDLESIELIIPGKLDKRLLCLLSVDKLREALMPTFETLYNQIPESIPFRQPTNAYNPEFFNFFVIIKNPIDMSIIRQNLEFELYVDAWDYVDDVWRMLNNAWLYSRRCSQVYRYCKKLAKVFTEAIDPVMKSLGYCCGRNYLFSPKVHCCYGNKFCIIRHNDKYYSYDNRYSVCKQCFEGIPDNTVTFINSSTQYELSITKNLFLYRKFEDSAKYIFVYCKECGRKFHKLCVLYFEYKFPSGYTCDTCMEIKQSQEIQ